MQSVLSTSSTQAAVKETNSGSKVSETKNVREADSAGFSDVLKSINEEKAAKEAKAAEQSAADEIREERDAELEPEEITAENAEGVATDEQTEAPDEGEFSLLADDLEALDASSELDLLNAEANPEENPINPILAQIEAAKKMDTKVTDVNNDLSDVDGEFALIKEANKFSTGADAFVAENALNDAAMADENALDSNLENNSKIDSILSSLKLDADNSAFNSNQDSDGLDALSQASDKLLNKNINNTTALQQQSAALEKPVELQSKDAAAAMGEKIKMMINQGKHEVTIRLDPAELGSMQIKLHVQQDQVQVAIQTQVGQSRDIIEQNLPRLREQLEQQGINLGEATVEQQANQESNSQGSDGENEGTRVTGTELDPVLDEQADWISTQMPLPAQGIDYYA